MKCSFTSCSPRQHWLQNKFRVNLVDGMDFVTSIEKNHWNWQKKKAKIHRLLNELLIWIMLSLHAITVIVLPFCSGYILDIPRDVSLGTASTYDVVCFSRLSDFTIDEDPAQLFRAGSNERLDLIGRLTAATWFFDAPAFFCVTVIGWMQPWGDWRSWEWFSVTDGPSAGTSFVSMDCWGGSIVCVSVVLQAGLPLSAALRDGRDTSFGRTASAIATWMNKI